MSAASPTRLKCFLQQHPVITFLLMGVSFLGFGLVSLNLIYFFHANIELLLEYGWMGLKDGGLQQLSELLVSGYFGMAFYVLFKVCEKALVDRLTERPTEQRAQP